MCNDLCAKVSISVVNTNDTVYNNNCIYLYELILDTY